MTEDFSEKPNIDLVDEDPSTIQQEVNQNQKLDNLDKNKKIEIINESSSINEKQIHLDKEVRLSNYNTLDESVSSTLARDLLRIIHKIEYVLIPRTNVNKKKRITKLGFMGSFNILFIIMFNNFK